jgi:hypothetical protein
MMAQASGLRLVALKCSKCGSLLKAEPDDLVYYCNNCGTGFELINEKDELVTVNIDFALPIKKLDAQMDYLPFWVFDTDIRINSRDSGETLGSAAGFIKNIFSGGDGKKPVRKFYVPAFETQITNIRRLGMEFTKNQPEFESIKKDRLTGCRFSSRDAEKLADFIFLGMEAEKPDMLKNITYSLGLSSPRVIGIPFYKTGSSLTDGILGISIS